jgi:hypothetical protein
VKGVVMNIRAEVMSQFQRLAQQPGAGPHLLQVSWPAGTVTAELSNLQSLAGELHCLTLRSDRLARLDSDQLQHIAQRLADQIRYLLEPLQVHEIDRHGHSVQLRSSPPERESRRVRYFEATLARDGGLQLARYEKLPGEPRQRIPALITVEVLAKLCQDVQSIASPEGPDGR